MDMKYPAQTLLQTKYSMYFIIFLLAVFGSLKWKFSWVTALPVLWVSVGLSESTEHAQSAPHLLQVDVGLSDLLDAAFGERGVPQQKARQSLIVSQEMLQLESWGRKNRNRSEKPDTPPPPESSTVQPTIIPTAQRLVYTEGGGVGVRSC